jgi:hypothetical protein
MLAILATSYCLNRIDRVSSFYWTRGSKLCFLTCFSYFSCYFLILVFLRNRYLVILFAPFLAAWESDFSSCFLYHWHSKLVRCTCAPIILAQNVWVSQSKTLVVSSLTTGEFSPFCLFAKGFWCKHLLDWTRIIPFLLTKIFEVTLSCDLALAKLCSTAWVWNPQGTSKLVNKVHCHLSYDSFLALCSRQ